MWRFPYSSEEILKAVECLAQSYVPEWRLNRHTPDIGSVIAMIFAGQMEHASREYSRIPEQCIEELVHMLGICPNPPVPAKTILIMEVDHSCRDGIRIEKGSRFYANTQEADRPIVFRTRHDLLAVHAELTHVLGISEAKKKIVSYLEERGSMEIPIFDFSKTNLYQENIVLKDSLLSGQSLTLKRPFEDKKLFLEDVRIKAWGRNMAPLFLYDGEQELPVESAAIFGQEIFPYKECYIGQDEVFTKAGAQIACTFEMEWGRFDPNAQKESRKEQNPVIKRAVKSETEERPHIFPQEVGLTYFNGTGFKRLHSEDGTGILTQVFSGRKHCRIRFSCPEDIMPMTAGGYASRCLRLQVKRADNCYLPNAVFYYPILKNVKFSYTYGKNGICPEKVMVRQGSSCKELTEQIFKKRECELFSDFPYRGENVLFGFDRVWGMGPVSLYMEFDHQNRYEAMEIAYEYSTADGFKPLHITDGTQGLLKSGIIRFVLPADAGMLQIEGRNCFWIRMRDTNRAPLKSRGLIVKGLKLNGVEAENLYLSEEREYQLEKAKPGLTVPLMGSHILEASVWVNETSVLSDTEKERLLEEFPQDVQAEYDIRGQETEFYVKWRESVDLEKQEGGGRCYLLDRKAGLLKFGDGRHTKVPEETRGAAWKIKVTSCDGRQGNVEKGTVTDPALSYVFLNKVYNPVGAYGGSDGENDIEFVKRGRNFLSTGQKIVSEADIVNEAEAFSKQIAQAVLLKGTDAAYRLLILLREPKKGGFPQLKEALQVYLEERYPLAFLGHTIQIREPVFVTLSVNVWITAQAESAYGAEERLREELDSYLNGRTLRIGDIPRIKELEQVLYQASGGARIRYFQAVLTYTDETGSKETALEDMRTQPEAVFLNGSHRIYTEMAVQQSIESGGEH